MNNAAQPSCPRRSGFTLIEVTIALLLLGVLAGMVFGIARTSLNLGKAIVETQAAEMEQQAFYDLLSRRFASLPGNARLGIKVEESGRLYLSDLTLQDVPMSFTWGGNEMLAKAVQLSTVKTRSGSLDIVLRYYENEVLEGSALAPGSSVVAEEPYADIVLLRDVAYFEWRALDSTTMEWTYEWDDAQRLPLQLELVLAMGADGKPVRHVFWLPPKQNPELVMRQMGANTPVDHAGGGGGRDIEVDVQIVPPQTTEGGSE